MISGKPDRKHVRNRDASFVDDSNKSMKLVRFAMVILFSSSDIFRDTYWPLIDTMVFCVFELWQFEIVIVNVWNIADNCNKGENNNFFW